MVATVCVSRAALPSHDKKRRHERDDLVRKRRDGLASLPAPARPRRDRQQCGTVCGELSTSARSAAGSHLISAVMAPRLATSLHRRRSRGRSRGARPRTNDLFVIGHSLGAYIALALASGWFRVEVAGVLGIGPKITWSQADLQGSREIAARPARYFATAEEAWARYRRVSGLDAAVAPTDGGLRAASCGATRAGAFRRIRVTLLVAGAPFASLATQRASPRHARARRARPDGVARRVARALDGSRRHRGLRTQRARRGPGSDGRPLQSLIASSGAPDVTADEHRALAAGFDPARLAPAFFANPYPVYRRCASSRPCIAVRTGACFLTRYADLERIYRDRAPSAPTRRRRSARSTAWTRRSTSTTRRASSSTMRPITRACGDRSSARSRRLCSRRWSRTWSRSSTRCWIAWRRSGDVDLIEDFAAAIPVEVIGNLLRVPREDRGPLRGLVAGDPGRAGARAERRAARGWRSRSDGIPRLSTRADRAASPASARRRRSAHAPLGDDQLTEKELAAQLRVPAQRRSRDDDESHRQRPAPAPDAS